jgi:hypothetical protein
MLVVLMTFAAVSDAAARPFDPAGIDWEGCGEFVQIARDDLGEGRVIVTQKLDLHELKREDALVILHPERTLDVDNIASFMRHGGRVVLLDDYGTGDALLGHFGIQRVPMPRKPAEALRGNPSLAIAEPASAHPVVHEVGRVVTNHATGVKHAELSPVLKVRAVGESDVLVAQAGAVGQGRFLAVGDPSIVMNSMLRYPGNKAFARAIIRYATDDDTWGKRQGRIFIVSGDFDQKGAFGDDSALSDELNEWKRTIQDVLDTMRREGVPPIVAHILAALVGMAVIVWVAARAGKTHRPVVPRFTRSIPIVAQGGVAGHAAVIGAPSTSRVLAMLELKSALEEDLCALVDLDGMPGADILVQKLRAHGLLPEDELHALRQLLIRMANVETIVISRRAAAMDRIRDREVLETAKATRRILEAARARAQQAGAP